MKLFSRLFGKSNKKELLPTAQDNIDGVLTTIPSEELFINPEPPTPIKEFSKAKEGKIENFLKQDYMFRGQLDGYIKHSNEALLVYKRKIKSEFLFLVDQLIQEKEQRKLQSLNTLVDVAGISEGVKSQLENVIRALETSIETLETQKELSVEDEGWIMPALHEYHLGFMQGLEDYLAEKELLNPCTSI
jgi:hypothetical protein